MLTFERGAVVRVPFPYTNRPVQQYRPAVAVSSKAFSVGSHLLWVAMITSAENRAWANDIPLVENFAQVGLPAPSLIRTAKIATIEAAQAHAIGQLPRSTLELLDAHLRQNLAL